MNKSILLSIKPELVAKILNGEKIIEVRKKFQKDYIGWVYIYCTMAKPYLFEENQSDDRFIDTKPYQLSNTICRYLQETDEYFNGKVVARFWCDNVEEILMKDSGNIYTNTLSNNKLLTRSCLTDNKIKNYLSGNWHKKYSYWFGGYAIHISKLEIFDKPRELKEFNVYCEHKPNCWTARCRNCPHLWSNDDNYCIKHLTKAPQNYCYIEELENDK